MFGGCPYPKRNVLVTIVCFSWSYDMYTVNIACVWLSACIVCVCIQCMYSVSACIVCVCIQCIYV